MPPFRSVPVYLFYGNQVEPVLRARDALLKQFLSDEARPESLREYGPESNKFGVDMARLLPELTGELASVSFIADAPKMLVVTNPTELYAEEFGAASRKPKKAPKKGAAPGEKEKTPKEKIAEWIERRLKESGHRLVLLAYEDEGAGREVDLESPLTQLILRLGHAQGFRDNKAFFRIEDALLRRDATGLLRAVDDLWDPQHGGDTKVYNALVRTLRFLLQGVIVREKRVEGDPAKRALLMPAGRGSLLNQKENVQRKYLGGGSYRVPDLIKAYDALLEVYRAMRPRQGDVYVPDQRALLDQALMELMASPRPGRR